MPLPQAEALIFRKSSYSANASDCVEVADVPGASAIRDTKRRTDGHLPFPTNEWAAFLTTLTR
ncbi:DUF397 domain-containing protein [Nocardiopsis alba]|uniref:DUF397 domain-containing protein n=1 Tax=Nocardiopsis alba TaxID=53437 RepID=UPI0036CB5408